MSELVVLETNQSNSQQKKRRLTRMISDVTTLKTITTDVEIKQLHMGLIRILSFGILASGRTKARR
jgi:hypothetical protein